MGFVPAELLRAADEWESEAKNQRRVSAINPIADTLAYCAADLRERAAQVEAGRLSLSTVEFADAHGVAPGTVRKWIARGELNAERGADGDWHIPRSATRIRKSA
jgi:DNA-directed RNA polymerase specialized sigma24 family protein